MIKQYILGRMIKQYILDGHEPVCCHSIIEWAKWFETAKRHVKNDKLDNGVKISTVFLGLDHSFGDSEPMLFETMVFGGKLDQKMERYSTWDEAEEGHKKWLKKAKEVLAGEVRW